VGREIDESIPHVGYRASYGGIVVPKVGQVFPCVLRSNISFSQTSQHIQFLFQFHQIDAFALYPISYNSLTSIKPTGGKNDQQKRREDEADGYLSVIDVRFQFFRSQAIFIKGDAPFLIGNHILYKSLNSKCIPTGLNNPTTLVFFEKYLC